MENDFKSIHNFNNQYFVGCCTIGSNTKNYFSKLNTLEYQQTFVLPPKLSKIQKLSANKPKGFSFIIKAWQVITHQSHEYSYPNKPANLQTDTPNNGHFNPTDEAFNGFIKTQEIAASLPADGILFETPTSFTPTKKNIDNMLQFFNKIDRQNRFIIWDAKGIWSINEIIRISKEIQIIPCIDPFLTDGTDIANILPLTNLTYFKINGLGHQQSISQTQLNWLANLMKQNQISYCIMNTNDCLNDAYKLKKLL